MAARALPLVPRNRNPQRGLHAGARHSVLQLQTPMIILLAGRLLVVLAQFSFPTDILGIIDIIFFVSCQT